MTSILILKFAALGDVLRTTSILPGLHARYPGASITWVTAPAARELVERHPLIADVESADPRDAADMQALGERLAATAWTRVLSFDDEDPLCDLATALGARGAEISGAWRDRAGARAYTPDVAPWFDMGLLSVHGKDVADRMKVENERSHPAIYADMLGIEMGRPELPLPETALQFAAAHYAASSNGGAGPRIGLNTGAGGRWPSKELSVERVVELGRRLSAVHPGAEFVVLGGPPEAGRNAQILSGLRALDPAPHVIDGGTDNSLTHFAALVGRCDLLVTSDSLALHLAIARDVAIVAFFAPTSAAEIELYGLGEKVQSTAPDACSYRPDADTSTVTPERIADAALRVLAMREPMG